MLQVIQGDILEFEPTTAFEGEYKVVANLPYNVTSPVLRHFLTTLHKPSVMVVMIQKEVAERIALSDADLHAACDLLASGCSPELAERILV